MSDDGWTWELSATAEDDLDGLAPAEQDQILDKLDEIVSSPWRDPPEYGEPLQNSPYRKIRVVSSGSPCTFAKTTGGWSSRVSSAVAARTPLTTTEE